LAAAYAKLDYEKAVQEANFAQEMGESAAEEVKTHSELRENNLRENDHEKAIQDAKLARDTEESAVAAVEASGETRRESQGLRRLWARTGTPILLLLSVAVLVGAVLLGFGTLEKNRYPEPPLTKACRYCGKQILAVAVKCKHCGSDIAGQESS
jgi:hypothetical protein